MNELQIHTLLEQAAQFRDEDKPLHAIQLLRQIITASPSCDKAFIVLAQIYYDSKQFDAAESVLHQGLTSNPGNADFHILMGTFHLRRFEYESALQSFLNVRHRHYPYVHLNLGLVYIGLRRMVEAERELKLAAQLDPKLPKVFEVLGEVLLTLKKTEDAINVLKHAARLDQYSGSAHRLLGDAFASIAQWQPAYDEYLLAVDMNPDDEGAWLGIASTLVRLNRLAEAKRYFERYLDLKPNDAKATNTYRSVCAVLGEGNRRRILPVKPVRPLANHDKN